MLQICKYAFGEAVRFVFASGDGSPNPTKMVSDRKSHTTSSINGPARSAWVRSVLFEKYIPGRLTVFLRSICWRWVGWLPERDPVLWSVFERRAFGIWLWNGFYSFVQFLKGFINAFWLVKGQLKRSFGSGFHDASSVARHCCMFRVHHVRSPFKLFKCSEIGSEVSSFTLRISL